jgi:hypothetical protein
MAGLLVQEERLVFACDNCEYSLGDIIDSAWLAGELEESWYALLQGLACEEVAVERGLQLDSAWLQTASEEFRYERDLLTVEETERWLEARQVSTQQFNDYFLRRYWRENLEDPSDPDEVSYAAAGPKLHELLRLEVILSGKFEKLARFMARRVLAAREMQIDPELLEAERALVLERIGLENAELEQALALRGRDGEWLKKSLSHQAAYRLVRQSLLTHEKLAKGLTQMRLQLTEIEFESLVFPAEPAAQEAALCLRENEVSISEIALESGQEAEKRTLFLDDCPEDVQRRLLCAVPGDVFGPDAIEEGFAVYRVLKKTDPSLESEEVRARLEVRLLESHFSEPMLENVRWLLPGCE